VDQGRNKYWVLVKRGGVPSGYINYWEFIDGVSPILNKDFAPRRSLKYRPSIL
jgi:hypothetical protein